MQKNDVHACVCHFFFVPLPPYCVTYVKNNNNYH
jgi:hypothetical protein